MLLYIFRGDKVLDADKKILRLRRVNLVLFSTMILILASGFVATITCFQCS